MDLSIRTHGYMRNTRPVIALLSILILATLLILALQLGQGHFSPGAFRFAPSGGLVSGSGPSLASDSGGFGGGSGPSLASDSGGFGGGS